VKFLWKIQEFPSLGTVPTDRLSIDLPLYTVTHEGHFEITVSFSMLAVNLEVLARQLNRISITMRTVTTIIIVSL
jgi:hypothetical protein